MYKTKGNSFWDAEGKEGMTKELESKYLGIYL